MLRLYWSNLPDANKPRSGTSALCNSLTTEDLPTPEYPETSTNSGLPLATTRLNEVSKVSISRSRPYNFSGIRKRSGVSYWPSGKGSMVGRDELLFVRFAPDKRELVPIVSHSSRQRRRSA